MLTLTFKIASNPPVPAPTITGWEVGKLGSLTFQLPDFHSYFAVRLTAIRKNWGAT